MDKIHFLLCYNHEGKIPNWIFNECSDKVLLNSGKPPVNRTAVDYSFPPEHRTNSDDYLSCNLPPFMQKGHLHARSLFFHDLTILQMCDIFSVCAPQHHKLNKGKWLVTESVERRLTQFYIVQVIRGTNG